MDLDEAIGEFLTELKLGGKSAFTVKNYRSALKKFSHWCEENGIDYRSLTPKQARQFRNYLASMFDNPATVNVRLSALSSFYEYLIDEGVLSLNPVNTRKLRLPEPETMPRFLTEEEIKTVLAYADEHLRSVALPYRTMLYSGIRAGEAARLTPKDVLNQNGRVVLRVYGKGQKERYVPVTDAETAKRLLDLAAAVREKKGPNARLFGVSYNTLVGSASTIEQATGVDFKSHRLRHTFATRLRAKGEELDVIQKLLGHRNIITTAKYAMTPAAWERLAAKVC